MAKKLTQKLKAERLLVQAALDMTRIKGPMRRACLLVLAEGKTFTEAARLVKRDRQMVYRAVRTVAPRYREVKQFAEQLA